MTGQQETDLGVIWSHQLLSDVLPEKLDASRLLKALLDASGVPEMRSMTSDILAMQLVTLHSLVHKSVVRCSECDEARQVHLSD